ncbi:MAG: hypothetical protein GC159_02350 [Phycisphaera sp.]|nr:hypothetical protein [Phycisphaera sp.]
MSDPGTNPGTRPGTQPPCILFTAFEPSGDEHAAPIIAELRRRAPNVPIYALGGARMEAAGATLIERTTDNAVMLSGAIAKAWSHKQLLGRLKRWMADHPVRVHVPTDSPAANWAICKMVKRMWGSDCDAVPGGAKVVHMVAPQVWAWASWRVRRLQKWSDLVLCVLPFEPAWFAKHNVNARFIGHPVFDEALDVQALQDPTPEIQAFRKDQLRVALLPGSRPGELQKNFPIMLSTILQVEQPLNVLVAAPNEARSDELRQLRLAWEKRQDPLLDVVALTDGLDDPIGMNASIITGDTEAVLHWADIVLLASGTASLHVARHGKPMVIMYRVPGWQWHLIGRWLIDTRTYTLPNLIACGGPSRSRERHIVPEVMPLTSDNPEPVVREMTRLIESEDARRAQVEALAAVCEQFKGHDAGAEAAEAIMEISDLGFGISD